ncbi:helix-turn-helix transcriptional regulator [Maricaulis sp. CAU 1757]
MVREEQRELRNWRRRQALGVVSLFGLAVPATAILAGLAITQPDTFLTSPAVLLLPVALLWVWLLHRSPRRWWQAHQDKKSGKVEEWRGPIDLVERWGIGLFPVRRCYLRLDGELFPISRFWVDQVVPGLDYTVRFAPESHAVLSLQRHGRSGGPIAVSRSSHDLTRREKELLRYIAEGLTDKEIARVLRLSPSTVRTYNSELYSKLGIERRTQAVPIAHELGLRGSDNAPLNANLTPDETPAEKTD